VKKRVSFLLDPDVLEQLRSIKARTGLSESEQIRQGIHMWLESREWPSPLCGQATVAGGLSTRRDRDLTCARPIAIYGHIRAFTCIEGGTMAIVGLAVTLLGFVVAASSVGLTAANGMRLVIVLVGIAISLGGIMGLINPAYQKNAVWKR
jgi:predicted phage tail protein